MLRPSRPGAEHCIDLFRSTRVQSFHTFLPKQNSALIEDAPVRQEGPEPGQLKRTHADVRSEETTTSAIEEQGKQARVHASSSGPSSALLLDRARCEVHLMGLATTVPGVQMIS